MPRCEACGQHKLMASLRRVGHPTTGDAEIGPEGEIVYSLVCVDSMGCQRSMVAQRRLTNDPRDDTLEKSTDQEG